MFLELQGEGGGVRELVPAITSSRSSTEGNPLNFYSATVHPPLNPRSHRTLVSHWSTEL